MIDDDDLISYWRGYVAGARRGARESERVRRYQEMALTIARSEEKRWIRGPLRLDREELISVAYEATLECLRRHHAPPDSFVAQTIRGRIVDAWRARFAKPSIPLDDPDLLELEPSQDSFDVESAILWAEVARRADGQVDHRLYRILQLRSEGVKLKAIGEQLGLSESRVSQILSRAQSWLQEQLLPLTA